MRLLFSLRVFFHFRPPPPFVLSHQSQNAMRSSALSEWKQVCMTERGDLPFISRLGRNRNLNKSLKDRHSEITGVNQPALGISALKEVWFGWAVSFLLHHSLLDLCSYLPRPPLLRLVTGMGNYTPAFLKSLSIALRLVSSMSRCDPRATITPQYLTAY